MSFLASALPYLEPSDNNSADRCARPRCPQRARPWPSLATEGHPPRHLHADLQATPPLGFLYEPWPLFFSCYP